ncbi:conjugal transfer protein TraY [Photobacterium frigidiphilum]|uniref:Relaxosome protein TraY n=1 Tax=Photobacterium frigidiphilum TaxID=264736 RepID=A0A2T3J7V5_9GAMM|nr:TraY domain-containing protein [Photobacterium frigidiphilum]PSU44813.1 conjugal transfer protein TraY [Photobacterium frigidiphilum]
MTQKKYITVSVFIDEECNALLNASAKSNERAKRKEAGVRIKDHLLRFGGAGWKELASTHKKD